MIKDPTGGRGSVRVYRFPEPAVDGTTRSQGGHAEIDTLTLTYPDGPHDSEALLVDPVDGDLDRDHQGLDAPGEPRSTGPRATSPTDRRPSFSGSATVPGSLGTLVTAADVSPGRIGRGSPLLRSGSALPTSCGRTAVGGVRVDAVRGTVAPAETQGESLGFAADGASYLTVSEGDEPSPSPHRPAR